MSAPQTADRAAIEAALRVILEPGQVTELRALNVAGANGGYTYTLTGYFNDIPKLAAAAAGISTAEGVCFTPNPTDPALLARAYNRIRKAGSGDATSDSNILVRRWFLVDCDATRLSRISATDGEHNAALARARDVREKLTGDGWPDPIVADSGNGGHLMYRIDLPADDAGLVERALQVLAFLFDDKKVTIDSTVSNPARIWKLYGTVARKGDSIPDRPHRVARMIEFPTQLEVVSKDLLESLASSLPPAPPAGPVKPYAGGVAGKKLDLDRWITKHGLDVIGPDPWQGGQKWIFRVCPWDPQHTNRSAFIVERASGGIAAGCHHDGCSGNDWSALRDLLEPGRNERKAPMPRSEGGAPANEAEDRGAPPRGENHAPPPPDAPDPTEFEQAFVGASRTYSQLIADRTIRPPSVLGDGLLYPRQIGMIHGEDGSRKSWAALHLVVSAACGLPWFGIPTREGGVRVGLISLEDELWTLQERLTVIAAELDADEAIIEKNLRLIYPPEFDASLDLTDPAGQRAVTAWVKEHQLELTVVDHLARSHDLPDEKDLRPVTGAAIRIARECSCGVLFLHHDRRSPAGVRGAGSSNYRGDSRLAADCRFRASMKEIAGRIRFEVEKSTGRSKPQPFWLEQDEETGVLRASDPPAKAAEKAAENRARMLELIGQAGSIGVSPSDLTDSLPVAERTIRSYAAKLEAEKLIARRGKANNTRYYLPSQLRQGEILPDSCRTSGNL